MGSNSDGSDAESDVSDAGLEDVGSSDEEEVVTRDTNVSDSKHSFDDDSDVEEPSPFLAMPLEQDIVTFTNLEGRRVKAMRQASGQSYHYVETDAVKIRAFFGMWYMFSLTGLREISLDDIYSTTLGMEAPTIMSRNRFKELLRVLRFDDKSKRNPLNKIARIQELFNSFTLNCRSVYTPGKDLTVDESMADFRGNCSFVMYISSKLCKYGIKIWSIVDANTHFLCNAEIYCGKVTKDAPPEKDLGMKIVLIQKIPASGGES